MVIHAIVEFRHGPAAENLAELEERAFTLRNSDTQERFAVFTQFSTFGNVPEAMEIQVRTREHVGQCLTMHSVGRHVFLQPRESNGPRRLGHRAGVVENIFDGSTDFVGINRDNLVEVIPT